MINQPLIHCCVCCKHGFMTFPGSSKTCVHDNYDCPYELALADKIVTDAECELWYQRVMSG